VQHISGVRAHLDTTTRLNWKACRSVLFGRMHEQNLLQIPETDFEQLTGSAKYSLLMRFICWIYHSQATPISLYESELTKRRGLSLVHSIPFYFIPSRYCPNALLLLMSLDSLIQNSLQTSKLPIRGNTGFRSVLRHSS
jgi:hypothetical protein